MMRAIPAFVCLLLLAAAARAEERPNLLKNGDFEKLDPNGLFEGWRTWESKEEPGIKHDACTDAHSGKYCSHLATQGPGYHGGVSQFFELKAGCRYKFSAWIKIKMHGAGYVRCCYQETRRIIDGKKHYPQSVAAEAKEDCDWTYMENLFDTQTDKNSSYGIHAILAHGEVEVWLDDAELIECGPVFTVDNGKLKLGFGSGIDLVGIAVGKEKVGSLQCAVAQFEKKGIGYKKTGIGSPGPAIARSFEVKERSDSKCVVDVTCEWTGSEETKRKFEAVYRITVLAGQPWFECRLLSIRNTDTIAYDGIGYYHVLQPTESAKASPKCFATCAAWVRGSCLVGAAVRNEEDFVLGLRKGGDEAHGDITRKLGIRLEAGKSWEGDEPSVFVFVAEGITDQDILRMRDAIMAPPAPSGKLTYTEAAGDGK